MAQIMQFRRSKCRRAVSGRNQHSEFIRLANVPSEELIMRRVKLIGTDIETSALGFGCASLGSRISRVSGLRALETAFDHGVSWYDVAPPYGAGEGEAILGAFLRGKRDRVQVCSKVGLTHPQHNGIVRLAYAVGRPVVGRIKGLRSRFRGMPSTRYQRTALTAASITASLDRSLRQLKADYLDVFALHDPAIVDVARDEVLHALENAVRAGKTRYLSVAGNLCACIAGVGNGMPFHITQVADDPRSVALIELSKARTRPTATITHSIFGLGGAMERLCERMRSDVHALRRLLAAGYQGADEDIAAALLLDRALASNPDGVVLSSMFSENHLRLNIERASRPPDPAVISLVAELFERNGVLAAHAR